MGWGASWEIYLQSEEEKPSTCGLFCVAFPVRTEGAFSGQPEEAQAVTGCPFLCELLPAVQGQKAVLSPQSLGKAVRWFIWGARDIMVHYLTRHVPSLATLHG